MSPARSRPSRWAGLALALLLGCAEEAGPDPIAAALAPGQDLAACDALAFPDMVTPCRLEIANREAAAGAVGRADAACAGIQEPTWKQECWFQVGEALARRGQREPALRRCARAGPFVEPCISHLAWGQQGQVAGEDPAEAARLYRSQAWAGLADLPEAERAASVRTLLAGHWIYAYHGTGQADRAPIRDAPVPELARTGYALEGIRLLLAEGKKPDEAVAALLAAEAPLTGAPFVSRGRLGRKARPILPEALCELPLAPTWGGGQRLVGRTEADDLEIAALEALFFQPQVPAQAFVPWLSDPRDRVRWTATKLFVLGGGPELSPELPEAWTDPIQRAHLKRPDCRESDGVEVSP